MAAGKKKTRKTSPPKASPARFEWLRRWRTLDPAKQGKAFDKMVARALANPDYRAEFLALFRWLVEVAPCARGRKRQLTVEQMNEFSQFMWQNAIVRPGPALSIKRAYEMYAGEKGIAPSLLKRAWQTAPEFARMRALGARSSSWMLNARALNKIFTRGPGRK